MRRFQIRNRPAVPARPLGDEIMGQAIGNSSKGEPLLEFSIGDREIGDHFPALVIGEIAQAHDGSLGMAHAFVDAIADAGADAVKFQMHIAAAESTSLEPFRVPLSGQDVTRYDYWRRMEFTPEQWTGLFRHAEERNLIALCSPFSLQAVEVLSACGIQAWKVASGELRHLELINRLAETKKPMILSTGMSTWTEIGRAVEHVRSRGAMPAVLQCTSKYPTPPEEVGVGMIPLLRRRFGCVSGLSDHSGTIYPSILAAAVGGRILEVHVTLTRDMYGPDVIASITTSELKELIRGVRVTERMVKGACVDKDQIAVELEPLRISFARSITARRAIEAGAILSEADVVLKKPGTGISPELLPEIIGRRATRKIPAGSQIQLKDIAPASCPVPTSAR